MRLCKCSKCVRNQCRSLSIHLRNKENIHEIVDDVQSTKCGRENSPTPGFKGTSQVPVELKIISVCKKKGMVLYSAVSSPLDRSKRFTLSSPGRPVHSDTVLGFSWKHSSHAAIAQRLFTHMSTTVYSQVLIYTAESTEASWNERKCPNFETVTTGIRNQQPTMQNCFFNAFPIEKSYDFSSG